MQSPKSSASDVLLFVKFFSNPLPCMKKSTHPHAVYSTILFMLSDAEERKITGTLETLQISWHQ